MLGVLAHAALLTHPPLYLFANECRWNVEIVYGNFSQR